MAIESEADLIILGFIGLIGNTIAVVIGAALSARNARRAQEDAVKAQVSTSKAAEALETAKRAVTDSNRRLIAEARQTNRNIDDVGAVGRDTNEIAHTTHRLINGQRTKFLYTIMILAERAAQGNPTDSDALAAAVAARKEYEEAAVVNKDNDADLCS